MAGGERVDLYLQMRLAVQRSTTQLLFGQRLGSDDAFFDDLMQPVLNLVDHAPFTVTVKRRLRTPQFRSAMAAREIVDKRVYAEIEWVRRNAASEHHGHLMNTLVHGTGEAGEAMSDLEIAIRWCPSSRRAPSPPAARLPGRSTRCSAHPASGTALRQKCATSSAIGRPTWMT